MCCKAPTLFEVFVLFVLAFVMWVLLFFPRDTRAQSLTCAEDASVEVQRMSDSGIAKFKVLPRHYEFAPEKTTLLAQLLIATTQIAPDVAAGILLSARADVLYLPEADNAFIVFSKDNCVTGAAKMDGPALILLLTLVQASFT